MQYKNPQPGSTSNEPFDHQYRLETFRNKSPPISGRSGPSRNGKFAHSLRRQGTDLTLRDPLQILNMMKS